MGQMEENKEATNSEKEGKAPSIHVWFCCSHERNACLYVHGKERERGVEVGGGGYAVCLCRGV